MTVVPQWLRVTFKRQTGMDKMERGLGNPFPGEDALSDYEAEIILQQVEKHADISRIARVHYGVDPAELGPNPYTTDVDSQ